MACDAIWLSEVRRSIVLGRGTLMPCVKGTGSREPCRMDGANCTKTGRISRRSKAAPPSSTSQSVQAPSTQCRPWRVEMHIFSSLPEGMPSLGSFSQAIFPRYSRQRHHYAEDAPANKNLRSRSSKGTSMPHADAAGASARASCHPLPLPLRPSTQLHRLLASVHCCQI